MRHVSRREVLKTAVVGGAAAMVGLKWPRPARADVTWGDLPSGIWAAPPDLKVLEIHLLGGMAPFESFYYRPGAGLQTRGFDAEFGALQWNPACTGTPIGIQTQLLGQAQYSSGQTLRDVHLGPLAKPLWRQDIFERIRVIVLAHDLEPHEAAIPYALTGLRLGRPSQASLGAAIAHRFNALDQAAGATRALPYAYGLLPETALLGELLATTMSATGTHPGSARPVVLRIGPGLPDFVTQLQRANMTPGADALLDDLRGQYRDWLRWTGTTDLTRSRAFRDYDTAVTNLVGGSTALSNALATLPVTIPTDQKCARLVPATFDSAPNPTRTAMNLATFLLTRPPEQAARYVCVVDGGLESSGRLPYDVHSAGHPDDTSANLWNVLDALAHAIRDPANPSADDAGKLDLDHTLVVINTEFGRTPFKSIGNAPDPINSQGRDHWPFGYVNVLIGGGLPRGVAGSIKDDPDRGGSADVAYTPTDMRAAVLLAAGIDPFANDNYALGSLSGAFQATTHPLAMTSLRQILLGVS